MQKIEKIEENERARELIDDFRVIYIYNQEKGDFFEGVHY